MLERAREKPLLQIARAAKRAAALRSTEMSSFLKAGQLLGRDLSLPLKPPPSGPSLFRKTSYALSSDEDEESDPQPAKASRLVKGNGRPAAVPDRSRVLVSDDDIDDEDDERPAEAPPPTEPKVPDSSSTGDAAAAQSLQREPAAADGTGWELEGLARELLNLESELGSGRLAPGWPQFRGTWRFRVVQCTGVAALRGMVSYFEENAFAPHALGTSWVEGRQRWRSRLLAAEDRATLSRALQALGRAVRTRQIGEIVGGAARRSRAAPRKQPAERGLRDRGKLAVTYSDTMGAASSDELSDGGGGGGRRARGEEPKQPFWMVQPPKPKEPEPSKAAAASAGPSRHGRAGDRQRDEKKASRRAVVDDEGSGSGEESGEGSGSGEESGEGSGIDRGGGSPAAIAAAAAAESTGSNRKPVARRRLRRGPATPRAHPTGGDRPSKQRAPPPPAEPEDPNRRRCGRLQRQGRLSYKESYADHMYADDTDEEAEAYGCGHSHSLDRRGWLRSAGASPQVRSGRATRSQPQLAGEGCGRHLRRRGGRLRRAARPRERASGRRMG